MPRPSRWDDIVAAAAKVFGERGFAAASMEDIGNEVGMWKGSLYNYVSSKEELLEAVIRRPAGHILESVRELEHQDLPASEKLRAVARNHTAVLEETFDFAAVYLHEIAGRHLNAEWREMDREYVAAVERIITEGIADGSFAPSTNPRAATMSFIGALNWLTRWWTPTGTMSASDVADQIAGTLLSGLLTRKRARPPAAPPRALKPRSRRVTKE